MGIATPECRCGQEHPRTLTRDEGRALARTIKKKGPTTVVRGYRVPRVWLAYHDVNRLTFPIVARMAKWERVAPVAPRGASDEVTNDDAANVTTQ